jgi:hypothetical protein
MFQSIREFRPARLQNRQRVWPVAFASPDHKVKAITAQAAKCAIQWVTPGNACPAAGKLPTTKRKTVSAIANARNPATMAKWRCKRFIM